MWIAKEQRGVGSVLLVTFPSGLGVAFFTAADFLVIDDTVLTCEVAFQQNHKVVGQAEELGLHFLGGWGTGPCLCFGELVFEGIVGLLDIPTS